VNSLPKTVTRQRRDCDLNPGPSEPQSSTLTNRLPSHNNDRRVLYRPYLKCWRIQLRAKLSLSRTELCVDKDSEQHSLTWDTCPMRVTFIPISETGRQQSDRSPVCRGCVVRVTVAFAASGEKQTTVYCNYTAASSGMARRTTR